MPLPGDDLVSYPMVETTHAVTINAPPQQVWPWLVQTGQGRAGFYSDSRFRDRSVDWYYRRLSRGQPGRQRSSTAWRPLTGSSLPDRTYGWETSSRTGRQGRPPPAPAPDKGCLR
jgi:hypothetical protein